MEIQRDTSIRLVLHGVIGGLIGGLVFLLADMVIAAGFGMPLLAPLAMISSVVLGPQALQPTFSMATAVIVGLVVYGILSAIYGIVFTYILGLTRQLTANFGLVLVYGFVYGTAIWVLNFLILAPFLWPQFAMVDQFWLGFLPHSVFFGLPLAGYLLARKEHLVKGQAS